MLNKKGGKSMFDGFVQIEGISGESSDEKHAGWSLEKNCKA
jgi:type VI protein secretion system component Hcp